jgi:hypothetical protein
LTQGSHIQGKFSANHILEGDPIAKQLFERKNLVAGSKRGKNIQELISPTVQKKKTIPVQTGPRQERGSFQCNNHKIGRKCDLCKHMEDMVEFVYSQHLRTRHQVKGHLVHQPRDKQLKDRWFVYLIEDVYCNKQYIGSTTDMYGRWGNHKSGCNTGSAKTGLSSHFAIGCPGDTGREKDNLKVTLVDHMDVTKEEVAREVHGGVGCMCNLCQKLKEKEDSWIMKLGTFYYPTGLNKRDEIKRKARSSY